MFKPRGLLAHWPWVSAFYSWMQCPYYQIFLGARLIGDIATPAERGGYFGLFSLGPVVVLFMY